MNTERENYFGKSVAVCVCTFNRNDKLRLLLESLGAQTYPASSWRIVVVENYEENHALSVVEKFRAASPVEIIYLFEAKRGVSHARNTAVREADSHYIAFIDDDEVAVPNWLNDLMLTALKFRCEAVLGPVVATYPSNSKNWAKSCGAYDRPRHRSGAKVDAVEGRTGNALVKSNIVKALNGFDPMFALTGGEDYDFFRRLSLAEGSIVWCDEATVYEEVPLERQSVHWVVSRALRGAIYYWRSRRSYTPWTLLAAQGLAGLLLGLLLLLLGLIVCPINSGKSVKLVALAAKGLGRFLALTNLDIEAYGRS